MPTFGEQKHNAVVQSALLEIARQLKIQNMLMALRIHKQFPSEDTGAAIDKILEG